MKNQIIKIYSLVLIAFVFPFLANAQNSDAKCIKKITKYSSNWEMYKALELCDKCLINNANSPQLYYERGMVNYYLNLMRDASSDFNKALSFGEKNFDKDDIEFMKWMSDTLFIIKNITDSLVFPELKPELNYKKQYGEADSLQGMLTQERTCFNVVYENLTVKIMPDKQQINGQNEITFIATDTSSLLQFDLYSNMNIIDINQKGEQLNYFRRHNAIFVKPKTSLIKGETYTITIRYDGIPRNAPDPPWNGGFVWKKNGDRYYIGVACEHLGASSWWPTKDHLSDKPDSMDINIIAPSGYDVIANGNLLKQTDQNDGFTKSHWHVSYPINNYNVTFYIGDFINFSDSYVNDKNQKVMIDYYVLEKNLEKAKKYYSGTKRIVEVFEELFGNYAFPKDGLAYIESPFAGMEHQSAIAIGGDYGKDSIYDMIGIYDFLVIHETAHEWWGNAVAVGDMADVWINEGFATYAEHLFVEKEFGEKKYIEVVGDNMFNISNIWPVVGIRNVNDNAFQGQDVYSKGATMLHSLRCVYNNDKSFFRMIKQFYLQSKMKITTTNDFINHANKFTSKDLDGFFEVFLHQSEPPTLQYSFSLKNKKFNFKYKWINVPKHFKMPFLLVFNYGQGYRVEGTTKQKELNLVNVKNFYIFSQSDFDPRVDTKNAFTYFHSNYVK